MNILRRIAIGLLGVVLFFSLLSTAWSHVGQATIANRETVKRWLDDSSFYDRIVLTVLENVSKNENAEAESNGESNSIPLSDPQVQAIAQQVFTPEYIKENVEIVLNSTYSWLEGETVKPEFSIDLTEAKQRLADGAANYAVTRAASLPACTQAQLQEMAGQPIDILGAECLPPGTDVQALATEMRTEILANEDFLKETALTGEDIKVESNGQQVPISDSAEFARVQDSYKFASYLPYIAATLAILTAVGIVFLSSSKRKGIRRAGVLTLIAGVILGINYLALTQSSAWMNKYVEDVSNDSTTGLQLATDVVNTVVNDVSSLIGWYALGFTLAGLTAILLTIFVGKSKKSTTKPATEESTTSAEGSSEPIKTATESSNTPTTPTTPTKKPPRKIQL